MHWTQFKTKTKQYNAINYTQYCTYMFLASGVVYVCSSLVLSCLVFRYYPIVSTLPFPSCIPWSSLLFSFSFFFSPFPFLLLLSAPLLCYLVWIVKSYAKKTQSLEFRFIHLNVFRFFSQLLARQHCRAPSSCDWAQ